MWTVEGSWPHVVKQGGLEGSHQFPVQRRGGKTASFLRAVLSIFLVEGPAPSTSPKLAKSRAWVHSQLLWVWGSAHSQVMRARKRVVIGQKDLCYRAITNRDERTPQYPSAGGGGCRGPRPNRRLRGKRQFTPRPPHTRPAWSAPGSAGHPPAAPPGARRCFRGSTA